MFLSAPRPSLWPQFKPCFWRCSLARQPYGEPGHPLARELDLLQRCGEEATNETFTARAKGAARHTRHLLLLQWPHGELLRTESSEGDVRERVERAARAVAVQPHLVKRVDNEIATQPVLLA